MTRALIFLTNLRLPQTIARFRRDQSGITSVEFAFVATPFFALLFAIMQTAIVMFANQTLQTVTSTAARKIMIGDMQGKSLQQFKDELCSRATFVSNDENFRIFKCADIKVQVQSFAGFTSATPNLSTSSCFNDTVEASEATDCWQPGGPSSVVVVRTTYKWPFGLNLEGPSVGTTLVAVSAFRNEPF